MEVPFINWMQKLVLYETKARFYIVGSNKIETRFRVLKIDRTEPHDLIIHDDKVEYSRKEIRSVLSMIDGGNKSKRAAQGAAGLSKTTSAFGIAGFVRFLEGPYIILITKRKKAALIGPHTVYKIEDTSMLYIPNETVRYVHPDESRYVRMFQNVDLSSNFYFSYSYDLTHNLQYNMANIKRPVQGPIPPPDGCNRSKLLVWEASLEGELNSSRCSSEEIPDIAASELGMREASLYPPVMNGSASVKGANENESVCGIRQKPTRKFVWNNHLLKQVESKVHHDWILYIIHGFIGQSNIGVYGKSIYLTLIGRRSNEFAGTRFLKRGANCEGSVANEIETEQIVQDTSVTFLAHTKVSSYVQLRGSVPLFWSQDLNKMGPKPPITLDQRDPYASVAGRHFNQVLRRYGAPVIVLNLVKTRERKRHESILSEEFVDAINYLNQFLPPQHAIQYIGFDMARVTKRKNADVMMRLARIARYCLKQTGIFFCLPSRQAECMSKDDELKMLQGRLNKNGCKQTGVVRTNCVDCLDRTNTAQFALGKCALAYQLYALGVLEKPNLDFDTDCVKMLEELYEDHGDTVALQYGGSQLVHRIKGYRKIAPWTSHSRDIMQTLSRYYSNTFSDVEKQQAFNLFLGVFEPAEGQPNLWELPTDFYLHNPTTLGRSLMRNLSYSQWWDAEVFEHLPMPYEEVSKSEVEQLEVAVVPASNENVNIFFEFYRPFDLTVFDDLYQYYMSHATRKYMPKGAKDFSPFLVRENPEPADKIGIARLHSHLTSRTSQLSLMSSSSQETNPNISGKDSTASSTSQGSDDTSSSEDPSVEAGVHLSESTSPYDSEHESNYVSFKDLFPSMKRVYDTEIKEPNDRDKNIYERYVEIGQGCHQTMEQKQNPALMNDFEKSLVPHRARKVQQGLDIYPVSGFKLDSTFGVEPPPVSLQSREIYKSYVERGLYGAGPPTDHDKHTYLKYIQMKYM
ncbi:polyphosphoinositide phosphatase-like isoform X3 [Pomacea canaliculata]|uniref:polyphosphoinositide phosphatase-like isoform X3 n=1 Tax=Pomacea canaliculata TaxID=400727 RepID=UPI000D72DA74|nr:polyphosphoinositide phosphatase-like isoform X3 [Pomacea canaliculata]